MPLTADDLTPLIGSPPTAAGVAAAILLAVNGPATSVAPTPPDDHGLNPTDSAVTGVPRDETTPTPGVDLPPVLDPATGQPDPTQLPPESTAPSTPPPADDPLADAVKADEAKLATDEAAVAADQAQLATDEAAEASEHPAA